MLAWFCLFLTNSCLFHLLVQKYFDHAQIFLTMCAIFLNTFKFCWPWSKVIFYLMNLHIWAWSKIFAHIQKILNVVKKFWTQPIFFWTSRWIRHEFISVNEWFWRDHVFVISKIVVWAKQQGSYEPTECHSFIAIFLHKMHSK